MKTIINVLVALLAPILGFSQARVLFNGADIIISNNAKLVVQNPAANALTVMSSGGVVSEGANNDVLWYIGANAANYTVPFIAKGNNIPVSFTTSNAAGNGFFVLSTYAGPNWQNSNYLPPTVTNINRDGVDNSNHVIDRFWQVNDSAYITSPSLTNLIFSYNENEWSEAGNNIIESGLTAQSWNAASATWTSITGTDNASANDVTVAAVAGSDLHAWWTLVDQDYALPLTLLSFSAEKQNENALLKWTVTQQINVSYYEVQRSINSVDFSPVGKVYTTNNTILNNDYTYTDALNNINANAIYYRLRMVDRDGKFVYSPVRFISLIESNDKQIQLSPNPATSLVVIKFADVPAGSYQLTVLDATGKMVSTKKIEVAPYSTIYFHRNLNMASGTYFININGNNIKQTFPVIFQ